MSISQPGDLLWDSGKDVKWNLDQRIVTLHIGSPQQPGKVVQDGSGYDVHIGDYSGPSGYKYLKCWFDVHMLWGRRSLYIFPRVLQASSSHKAQLIFTETTSKKWYE